MGPMRQAGLAGDAINRQTWLLAASLGAVLSVLIWSMWCWGAVLAVASALGIGSAGRSDTLLCRDGGYAGWMMNVRLFFTAATVLTCFCLIGLLWGKGEGGGRVQG